MALLALGSATAETKVVTLPIWQDYIAAPTTLHEFVRSADAVARVRVEEFHVESVPDPATGRTRDVTVYTTKILETFKPHAMLSPTEGHVALRLLGGQHQEGETLIRSVVQGFEPLRENRDYLLCLSWNARRHDFDIFFGPNGVYELSTDGVVRPLGQQPAARQQQGKSVNAFLEEIREASAR